MKKLFPVFALSISLLAGCGGNAAPNTASVSPSQAVSSPVESSSATSSQPVASDTKTDSTKSTKATKALNVILLVPGNLGDQSFYDAANRGLNLIKDKLGATTKVVEMTGDSTKWEPDLLDAIDGKYDIIISGGSATETLNKIATQNPDQKFINYDTDIQDTPANVYSISYKSNEVSFLAGATAAIVEESNLPYANKNKSIGFIGGMDIPGINEFLLGYIEGAKYIDKDIHVTTAYAGKFDDPAKGKELALTEYKSGCGVIFNVAGGTGLGLFDAAKAQKKYAIGVDSDQASMFLKTDPEKASYIVTSAVKGIDQALLNSVKKSQDGTLSYGTHDSLGVAGNAVYLATDGNYDKLLTSEEKAKIDDIKAKISDGTIKIDSALGMSAEDVAKARNAAK